MCCICSYSAEKKTIVTSIAPASIIYLLKFHNRYIRERCEICSPEPRYFLGSAACIVDFEHIQSLNILTLNKEIFAWVTLKEQLRCDS